MSTDTYETVDAVAGEAVALPERTPIQTAASKHAMLSALAQSIIVNRLTARGHVNRQALDSAVMGNLGNQQAQDALNAGTGVTIHRGPKRGSVPCWGKCGRRVSAGRALCLRCQQAQASEAAMVLDVEGAD